MQHPNKYALDKRYETINNTVVTSNCSYCYKYTASMVCERSWHAFKIPTRFRLFVRFLFCFTCCACVIDNAALLGTVRVGHLTGGGLLHSLFSGNFSRTTGCCLEVAEWLVCSCSLLSLVTSYLTFFGAGLVGELPGLCFLFSHASL